MRIPVSQPCLGELEAHLVSECFRRNQLTAGPMVKAFEQGLADWLRVKHVVAVSSGTTALHLALAALYVGPGDEVLVPNLTYVATANAVRYCGAEPVLVDVNEDDWNLDLDDARRRLTDRTRAILPVHLYGMPCHMRAVLAFAEAHGLSVVEDAAEGLGGAFENRALGTFGQAGCFSFYGNKILTTGEGGAVATDSDWVAARARSLRGMAQDPTRRYYHTDVGFNYRMTDLQAAVGFGQLQHLGDMLAQRQLVMERYRIRLSVPLALPTGSWQAPWLFTFAPRNPRRLAERLAAVGIETRPTFVPLSRLPMYASDERSYDVSEAVDGLSLPTFADMTLAQVDEICDRVLEFQ